MSSDVASDSSPSAAQGVYETLGDPALLELLFVLVLSGLILWILLGLRGALRRLHGRKQLAAYLEGVEAVFAGDPGSAQKLLQPVVAEDPENLGARLALGEAHAALGMPADAHREHLEARQVFAAEGQKLQLAIVRDLRAAGELGEACLAVDEALLGAPKDLDLQREAWELKLEASLFEAALPHGRALFAADQDPRLRRRLAHANARAGSVRLQRGEQEAARELFRAALGYDAENHEARKGRIALGEEKAEAEQLLSYASGENALVPVDENDQALVQLEPEAHGVQRLPAMELFPESVCAHCGAPVPSTQRSEARFVCEVCGRESSQRYSDEGMQAGVQDASTLLDEIEENERYVQRLAEEKARGNDVAGRQLLGMGEKALHGCLDVALRDAQQDLLETIVTLARQEPEGLLSWRKARVTERDAQILGRLRHGGIDELLAPVFRRLGSDALPFLRGLLGQSGELAEAGLRGLVVHGYVGTADLVAFEDLSARMSPVEIVRHLNQVPNDELADWIAELPTGPSYVRDAILLDERLDKESAFALALARVNESRLVELADVLRERGPEDELLRTLVAMLGESAETAGRADAVLRDFGAHALPELVAAFADPSRDKSRERVGMLIHACGAVAVPQLARCFGGAPGESDDRCIELIARIGNPSVKPLLENYRTRPRWFGFVRSRKSSSLHPRACKLRALAGVGTPLAQDALRQIADEETDAELSSLARELLRKGAR
jgi:hypothetical protein